MPGRCASYASTPAIRRCKSQSNRLAGRGQDAAPAGIATVVEFGGTSAAIVAASGVAGVATTAAASSSTGIVHPATFTTKQTANAARRKRDEIYTVRQDRTSGRRGGTAALCARAQIGSCTRRRGIPMLLLMSRVHVVRSRSGA